MKIGISIPNNWGMADTQALIDLAVLAEELGFASVWTSEHLINTAYVRSRIGDGAYYHPLAILSAIASRTKNIKLGTSVIVLPFHNPFDIAKYIATLDQVSQGRVILGVGVGNVREEFEALNIEWSKRGALTDESLDVIKTLWSHESASYQGKHWAFSDIHTSPKPYQKNVPIWVGGMSEAAMRRTITKADGWQPTAITPDELRVAREKMREMAIAHNRDSDAFDICMRFNISLDDVPVTDVELRSTVKGNDTKGIIQTAQQFSEAGATHFIYALNTGEPNVLEKTIRELAQNVLPVFK